MTTVADFSERALIDRVRQRLAPRPAWLTVGIGDDAAVVEPERNRLEVLTVDALVEGVHFDRRFTPPDAIGHRALAVNLSDIAAMGAAPRLALLSFALPPSLPIEEFESIIDGLVALAAQHRVVVAGGNLTRTPGPMMLDVTVVGAAKRRRVLTRAGARAGDEVWVSGTIGSARAGLELLRQRVSSDIAGRVPLDAPSLNPDELRLANAYLRPEPRMRLGLLLGRNRAATACIDLSDGLADGVRRLAEAGDVGIEIDAAALPIDPAARALLGARTPDPSGAAVEGGDDYELLFTVRPRSGKRFDAVRRHADVRVTRIGVCTAGAGGRLRDAGRVSEVGAGYDHFRSPAIADRAGRHD